MYLEAKPVTFKYTLVKNKHRYSDVKEGGED